jgi:hypothetical protein
MVSGLKGRQFRMKHHLVYPYYYGILQRKTHKKCGDSYFNLSEDKFVIKRSSYQTSGVSYCLSAGWMEMRNFLKCGIDSSTSMYAVISVS